MLTIGFVDIKRIANVIADGYDATREIRRHPDPAVRNVLVIAMTASAIQGDREKCLEAGMNNYLAKPVRVHTLKTLLETYLSQNPKPMPNLQEEATKMARDVLEKAGALPDGAEESASPQPSSSVSTTATNTPPPIPPEGMKPYEDDSNASSNITVVHPGKEEK